MKKVINASPSYLSITKEIAQFIYKRKSSLFKRVILLTWPFLILFFSFPILKIINGNENIDSTSSGMTIFIVIAWILIWGAFCLMYIYFMRMLFFIEKVIWIDSFFDKENISDKESFTIAKNIFIPVMKIKIKLFFNYYFMGFVFYFGVIVICFLVGIKQNIEFLVIVSIADLVVVGPIALYVYFYYLDIKLRYFWFIYLDQYGTSSFSYSKIKDEMFKLNAISKGESYKKILIMNFGISSVNAIVNVVVSALVSNLEKLGGFEGAAGQSIKFFSEEYFNQVDSIGKLLTKYLLYRHARAELYPEQQIVNERLYLLKL